MAGWHHRRGSAGRRCRTTQVMSGTPGDASTTSQDLLTISVGPYHRPFDSRPGWVKVMGSLGRTPYFFCLARPNGHPPKVTAISTACKTWAILLPFLARVQIGHRSSQKSGSNITCLLNMDGIDLDWIEDTAVSPRSLTILPTFHDWFLNPPSHGVHLGT